MEHQNVGEHMLDNHSELLSHDLIILAERRQPRKSSATSVVLSSWTKVWTWSWEKTVIFVYLFHRFEIVVIAKNVLVFPPRKLKKYLRMYIKEVIIMFAIVWMHKNHSSKQSTSHDKFWSSMLMVKWSKRLTVKFSLLLTLFIKANWDFLLLSRCW